MKYIILEADTGMRVPVIFPDFMVHEDIARLMMSYTAHTAKAKSVPLSAGFINLNDISCHGESESLDIESRGADAAIIALNDSAAFMPDEFVVMVYNKLKGKQDGD